MQVILFIVIVLVILVIRMTSIIIVILLSDLIYKYQCYRNYAKFLNNISNITYAND